MTAAVLGFQIDSSQAAGAAADLDRLTSSAAKVEQAATKVSGAGTRMSRGFADLNPALDKIIGSLGRLEGIASSIDKRLDMMASAANRAAKANTVLDQSAIEASTAYKQLEASLNAVTAAQKKTDSAQASSLAMIDKQKAAIASLNVELAKLRNAPAPSQNNRPRPSGQNASQANVGNIAAQFFDIGTTAAFMNPATVAIQQGPQLAQAFAGQSTKQALSGLAGGLMAIVSPMSLAAIGLTATAAAAIQYGVGLATASTETKKLDDVLETHDGLLKRLDERYGSLTAKARGFATESANVLGFQSASDVRALRSATNQAQYNVFNETGNILGRVRGGTAGGNDLSVDSAYAPIEDALRRLRAGAKEGKPDFDAFYDSLYKAAALDPKFAKKADELALLVEQYRQGTKALEEMERVQRAVFNDRGPNGMLHSRGPTSTGDMGNLALYESQQGIAAKRRQQGYDAQVTGINARSPQERAAAARASAAAQYNNDETGPERRIRIEQAGTLALIQAEHQLNEAQRDRASSLDKIVHDQQSEIDLIGKTGGAAVALRKEYELTSQLRMDAARQGIEVDQAELDLIKQKSTELGKLTDLYNQRRFDFDMGQKASGSNLTSQEREIKQSLRGYGLPDDLKGANAGLIRQDMEREKNRAAIGGFLTDFRDGLLKNGGDIGKAMGDAVKNALLNALTKASDQAIERITNSLVSALFGGGKTAPGADAATGVIGKVFGSNDNKTFAAPVGAVTRMSLPAIGATKTGIQLSQISAASGITAKVSSEYAPRFQGLLNDLDKAGYPVKSLGEGGYSYRNVAGTNNLSKHSFGEALDINPRQNPWSHKFQTDMPANVNDIAKQNGLTWGGTWNKPDTMHFQVDKTSKALEGLSASAAQTAQATTGLGQTLASIPQALMANGGGSGILSGLTKYGMGLFSGSGQFASAWMKGGIGLYANGTDYAPGGMAMVGERGPELLNLPQGSQVMSNHKLMSALAANQNQGNSQTDVRVSVDQNGNLQAYVDKVSRSNAAAVSAKQFSDHNVAQRRGGANEHMRRYANQKG